MLKKLILVIIMLSGTAVADDRENFALGLEALENKAFEQAKQKFLTIESTALKTMALNNLAMATFLAGETQSGINLWRQYLQSQTECAIPFENLTKAYSFESAKSLATIMNLVAPTPPDFIANKDDGQTFALAPSTQTTDNGVMAASKASQTPSTPNQVAKAPRSDNIDAIRKQLNIQVYEALLAWRDRWQAGVIEGYFSSYLAGVSPKQHLDFKTWQNDRTKKVFPGRVLTLKLADIAIKIEDDLEHATVDFEQKYQSHTINDTVKKRLLFKWQSGEWLIYSELVLG